MVTYSRRRRPTCGHHPDLHVVSLLSLLVITAAAGCAVGPAAGAAADPARDHRRDQRDRPVPTAPGPRQRRHHRADPDLQRHARPARGGLRRASGGSSTTRATSCKTPLTVAARPPRAARRRQPGGDRRDPRAAPRGGRPDVAAGRRPDPAGQERPPRLRHHAPGRPHRADRGHRWPRPAASATGTGRLDGTAERHGRGSTSSGSPRRCCSLRQRREAHRRPGDVVADRDRRTTARPRGSGSATPARGPARDRERIFERFGRSAVPDARRGVRPRPVHRRGHRARARRHCRGGRAPARRAVRDHRCAVAWAGDDRGGAPWPAS